MLFEFKFPIASLSFLLHLFYIIRCTDLNLIQLIPSDVLKQKTGVHLTGDPLGGILNFTDISKERRVKLSEDGRKQVLQFLSNSVSYTFCVDVNQDPSNSGSIFAIYQNQTFKVLELKLVHKRHRLKLSYSPDWAKRGFAVEKFSTDFQPDLWQRLCVVYNNNNYEKKVIIYNKCGGSSVDQELEFQLPRYKFSKSPEKEFDIWIGQSNIKRGLYKGLLKNMVLSDEEGFNQRSCDRSRIESLNKLKQLHLIPNQQLTNQVSEVQNELSLLRQQVQNLQSSMRAFENCQCIPACKSNNGSIMNYEDSWQEGPCRSCYCSLQGPKCVDKVCPSINCPGRSIKSEDGCCSRCGLQCQLRGQIYQHLTNITIHCLRCHCYDGSVSCNLIDKAKECPQLQCPTYLQYQPRDQCCKKCQTMDMCIFSNCGSNAHCVSTGYSHKCVCDEGYEGDANKECNDVNECLSLANNNQSLCPKSSSCINTPGSYKCSCKSGYEYVPNIGCQIQCNLICQHNSTCIAPNKCSCAAGWMGPTCDEDIDECATGLVRCPLHARCFNVPGRYHCTCGPGFAHAEGSICKDINECSNSPIKRHSCTDDQACINTPGGHKCIPIYRDSDDEINSDCTYTNCEAMKIAVKNGGTITNTTSCVSCNCKNGVLNCNSIDCSCSNNDINSKCCPNCSNNYTNYRCLLRSSDKRGYCSDFKSCPRQSCSQPISLKGQCCPSCSLDDPLFDCITKLNNPTMNISHSNLMCLSDSRVYQHNSMVAIDNQCIQCLCWNGQFCCKASSNCSK